MPARLSILIVSLLIIFLVVIRFISLESDPPLFFAGYTQAHLTDPYHLTFSARNAVLFDDWNPFDYHRWDVFKYSLVSGVSYILFLVFGVSRIVANISGLLLCLGGVFLFSLGVGYGRITRQGIVTAVLLLLNSMLLFYGRLPFLENGLIFLTGLCFYIFIRFNKASWCPIVTGALISLVTLSGKLFGSILLAPVIMCLLYLHGRKALVPILKVFAGIAGMFLIYAFVFYEGDLGTLMAYYGEQTFGMYGTPVGLRSLLGFFSALLSFGSDTGFFRFTPFYILGAFIGLLFFVLTSHENKENHNRDIIMLFSITWIVVSFFSLGLMTYRPLRYDLFLYFPLSAMIAFLATGFEATQFRLKSKPIWLVPVIIITAGWYVLTQVYLLFVDNTVAVLTAINVMPLTIIIAAIMAGAAFLVFKRKPRILSRSVLIIVCISLTAGLVVKQGTLIYAGLTKPGSCLKDIGKEINQMVDPGAVLTGPYAPAFTIDNNLKGIIYAFGLTNVEKDLFKKYPISHVVIDFSNWKHAVRDFPELESAMELATFVARDFYIKLYRLKNAPVPMTDYEKGMALALAGEPDSSLNALLNFNRRYPENLAGIMTLIRSHFMGGHLPSFKQSLEDLPQMFPDNFRVHLFCAEEYSRLSKRDPDSLYRKLSMAHLKIAQELNPTLR